MNTRQAWDTADDWTPNEPTLRVIQKAVKGFSDYKRWERILRKTDQELTEREKQEGREA